MITTEFKAPPRLASSRDGDAPEISVFLPVYNEEPNLGPLHEKLDRSLAQLGRSAEIIYVDDGSSDGSLSVLREIAARDSRVRVIALRRNYGQTPAMAAASTLRAVKSSFPGMRICKTIRRTHAASAKIGRGYDVVSGWRKNRRDPLITRKSPSQMANWLISKSAACRSTITLLAEGLSARIAPGRSDFTARCIASFLFTIWSARARRNPVEPLRARG